MARFGRAVVYLSTGVLFLASLAFIFKADWSKVLGEISTARLVTAILVPFLIAARGLKHKSLSVDGSLLGFYVAFLLTLCQWSYMLGLMAFFVTSSKATKFREHQKRKIEGQSFKEGGQRNWLQVFCNGGTAAILSLLYLLVEGANDVGIDFHRHYFGSWVTLGVLGSVACSSGDTLASELGTVLGAGETHTYLITSWRRVPKGTNGGVSFRGLIASVLGGVLVGVGFAVGFLIGMEKPNLTVILKTVFVAAMSGFLGSLVDSLMGATLQFSGKSKDGSIVETRYESVEAICGIELLDNHSVNLLSNAVMALATPLLFHNLLHVF